MKTITRRRLTGPSVKPIVKVQWQFKAFYNYGVVEPLTGELKIQLFDRVNTDNFQRFINEFAADHPNDFHVIQVDNASFHCANKLIMPDNAMLLYQPPHSPQVNSAERLWQWSKGELANEIFHDLDELKEVVKNLFASVSRKFIASLTSQTFILNALAKAGMINDNQ